ncbi:MAG: glutamyl-tRNA reductase, partial [Gemmatimonadaceae bacterium]|nr:glutamyl-tRNA reductase [Gemmatimonadaceae bacterium]
MALIVAGINYRTAPIEVRERVAVAPHEVGDALAELRHRSGAREMVLLSTCNRTEVYLVEGEGNGEG